ncbi:MAG: ABC transporter permease [Bacteroidales bacterium]|nr:ABC transporter permease [Bacteroidales bacterium]
MFFKKKKYVSSASLSKLAWKNFRQNVPGMLALYLIALTVLVALFAYLIAPDSSPYANRQTLELGMQKPGFKVQVLRVRKNGPAVQTSFLWKMLFGAKSNFREIPITSFSFSDDKIKVQLFTPEGDGMEKSFLLADVVYPLAAAPHWKENSVTLTLINETTTTTDRKRLQKEIETENIQTKHYWLGTDQFGRDLLSRLIIGTRVSLSVGAISVFISLVVGILLGSLAGFYGGKTDDFISWFINVVWSIPTLLLVIAITFALGRGFWQIFVAVGLTMWVEVARVVRGQIISLREKEFVEAGFAMGYSDFRVIFRHILPNAMSPLIVISAANFAAAILIEAGLSFLGIGVQPPVPSWGGMIKEYYAFVILDSAYLALSPGIAIVILVLAFMTLGNTLRDALDVKILRE